VRRRELIDQRGLAHPRLTGEENQAASPPRSVIEEAFKDLQILTSL
jgi:hypothetical protein